MERLRLRREKEKAKRRDLAAERRKIRKRSTSAPMPTIDGIRRAWEDRTTSVQSMIHLGGMLHDLECFVDNSLVKDEDGEIVGREGGIRGWLSENMAFLVPRYKSLMRYKSIVKKLRQIMNVWDPTPTEELLHGDRLHPLLNEIERARNELPGNSLFESVEVVLNRHLDALERKLNAISDASNRDVVHRGKNGGTL